MRVSFVGGLGWALPQDPRNVRTQKTQEAVKPLAGQSSSDQHGYSRHEQKTQEKETNDPVNNRRKGGNSGRRSGHWKPTVHAEDQGSTGRHLQVFVTVWTSVDYKMHGIHLS